MSDEDEIDRDLEWRLYAQVHHQEDESSSLLVSDPRTLLGLDDGEELQLSIDVDPVKRRFLSNRYWSGETPPTRPPAGASNFRRPQSRGSGKVTTASVLGLAAKKISEDSAVPANKPVEVSGFKAYASILQSMTVAQAPNTSSTGNAKNFRKPQNVSKKGKVDNRPDNQLSKLERVQKYLAKAQKAEIAKKKSKKQQQQQQQKQSKPVTTISLDSSSSSGEDDDVIEIPVPPPPLVCLDDSSDESMQAPPTTKSTASIIVNQSLARGSRCSSPSSSIISDDFIAPLDRNCLSDSMDSVNMNEDELRAAGKSRTSVAQMLLNKQQQQQDPSSSNVISSSSAATATTTSQSNCKGSRQRIPLLYKNLIASQKNVTIEKYHEDASQLDDVVILDSSFTDSITDQVECPAGTSADGVVEEASSSSSSVAVSSSSVVAKKSRSRNVSTGDSVYAKGNGKRQQTATTSKVAIVSSSDDSENEVAVSVEKAGKSKTNSTSTLSAKTPPPSTGTSPKAKSLPVKRKSRTEPPSSESEGESAGVPYIRSGEAVSNAQSSPKRREQKKRQRRATLTSTTATTTATPQSDNQFISMISSIAQGGEVSDSDSVEIMPSTIEEITICSGEDNSEVDKTKSRKASALSFNEFPHESILKLVPIERKDPWFICDADRMGSGPRIRIKCLNCNEMGHPKSKCKKPIKYPTCYMCGQTGHWEPRCPNTICLQCGSPTATYQIRCQRCHHMSNMKCGNCRATGHPNWLCPEKWRRYHQTTDDVERLRPVQGTLIRIPKNCSVCGKRGHLAEFCRFSGSFLEFPVAPMSIMRYESIYPRRRYNDRNDSMRWRNLAAEEEERNLKQRKRRKLEREERRRRRSEQAAIESSSRKLEVIPPVEIPLPGTSATQICLPVIDEAPQPLPVEESKSEPPPLVIEQETVCVKEVPTLIESVVEKFKITVDVNSDERQVTSTTKSVDSVAMLRKLSPNSDSNYSFSDFFEKEKEKDKQQKEKEQKEQQQQDKEEQNEPPEIPAKEPSIPGNPSANFVSVAADFISLNGSESLVVKQPVEDGGNSPQVVTSSLQVLATVPQAVDIVEKESEARIYLSKDHSKMLINETGSKFLQELSKMFNIRVRLEWQAIGNLLMVNGLIKDQNAFHVELTRFLQQQQQADGNDRSELAMLMNNNQLPKRRDALIQVIEASIALLKTNLGNVYDLHRKVQLFDRHGGGKKAMRNMEKARRSLNMILFGQAGLRDGGRRLDELRQNLFMLVGDRSAANTVEPPFREQIERNFRYIFSSVRHDNYPDLLYRYNVWRRERRDPIRGDVNNRRVDGEREEEDKNRI